MTSIYIDGDACPVKDEVFRTAAKRNLRVYVVANARIRVPHNVEAIVVDGGADAADDWIAQRAGPGDAVITADIDLAARCVKAGAACIGPTGKRFTEDNIGSAVAMKDLMKQIRQATGREIGPKPFSDRDRRAFMKEFSRVLDEMTRVK